MDHAWAKGRRHIKISKLYLKALLRRGPNIFVALAWTQVFWLVLEMAAGNEDSHGYVRLSSVACYALALHIGGHSLLLYFHRRRLSHHALEFFLDLVTDVVGFAWINLAEEMLAQVFLVTARTTFVYAVLACAASLGAMEIGSCVRGLLDWPLGFDEMANQFDAGSFALPTSWLVTQSVHIALYGFFYRTSAAGGQWGRNDNDAVVVDVRLAASLFLLVYALLCTTLASRIIGGTVAIATIADNHHIGAVDGGGGGGGDGDGVSESRDRSHLIIRTVEAGGPFTAALASDVAASSPPRGVRGRREPRDDRGDGASPKGNIASLADSDESSMNEGNPALRGRGTALDPPAGEKDADEGDFKSGSGGAPLEAAAAFFAAAAGAVEAGRARRDALRRGLKAYVRITVGMMVGWAYNLWGQVEFRHEELEFRFGPALGATVYATLGTALGVCIMVRGADKMDGRSIDWKTGEDARNGGLGLGYGEDEHRRQREEGERYESALRAFHAKRMLVVVGGISLMVGWAWEEAFDLMLDELVGDSADAGMVAAKLALAGISTTVVLGREMRGGSERHEEAVVDARRGEDGIEGAAEGGGDDGQPVDMLLEPLIRRSDPNEVQ